MKAIILAAGKTLSVKEAGDNKAYFPENSKPKCLFHFEGEVILERQVRILREAGINNIRIVVGYKKEMIEKFNEEKKLGLQLVYNPAGESDCKSGRGWVKGMESVRAGLQGIDDDVLIILGDACLTSHGIKKVLEDKHPVIWVRGGGGFQVFKIPRGKLPLLKKYEGGTGLAWNLHDFCVANKGVKMVGTGICDVDFYPQTDEGRANKG